MLHVTQLECTHKQRHKETLNTERHQRTKSRCTPAHRHSQRSRANSIIKDPSHSEHDLIALLPSVRRNRQIKARTNRLMNSFFTLPEETHKMTKNKLLLHCQHCIAATSSLHHCILACSLYRPIYCAFLILSCLWCSMHIFVFFLMAPEDNRNVAVAVTMTIKASITAEWITGPG